MVQTNNLAWNRQTTYWSKYNKLKFVKCCSYTNSAFLHFDYPLDEGSELFIWATSSRKWLQEAVEKQTFPRANYRKLAELALIWLVGELPGSKQFKFCKPGAFHHARFMSKAIYLLKMNLLSEIFHRWTRTSISTQNGHFHCTVLCTLFPPLTHCLLCPTRWLQILLSDGWL